MGKPRKPRSDAKMYQLPKDILQGVNERLVNCNMSCADICAWLAEKGYKVSQASLSRVVHDGTFTKNQFFKNLNY